MVERKTINAIEKGWSWEVRVVAIRRVSSDWDLAIEQQKRLINVLAQALKDEGLDDRWNAVEALGQIGPEARGLFLHQLKPGRARIPVSVSARKGHERRLG